MQMLLTTSEEAEREGQGDVEGLDLIPGTNVRFAQGQKVPPHGLERTRRPARPPARGGRRWRARLLRPSYYAEPGDENAVVTTTDYEVEFPSIVANEAGNVFGTQFHPRSPVRRGCRFCGTSSTSARIGEHTPPKAAFHGHERSECPFFRPRFLAEWCPQRTGERGHLRRKGGGTPFHPEKSGETGLQILRNFVDICAGAVNAPEAAISG